MSYGFLLRNNSNEIVVDGTNPCVFLHEQGRKSGYQPWRTPSNSAGWVMAYREPAAIYFSTPVYTHEPPFICAYADGSALTMGAMIGAPGNWTGFRCSTGWFPRSAGTGDGTEGDSRSPTYATVNYAVFSREGQVRSPSSYGFQVFNAGGQQVFDSRKMPFILEGAFGYARYGSGSGTSITSSDPSNLTLGMDVTAPSANHWPLLSGLNQMLFAMGGNYDILHGESDDRYYEVPRAMMKLAVERRSSTVWRFRFVSILEGFQGDETRPLFSDYNKFPNFGGGMGAVNLRLFARVPG